MRCSLEWGQCHYGSHDVLKKVFKPFPYSSIQVSCAIIINHQKIVETSLSYAAAGQMSRTTFYVKYFDSILYTFQKALFKHFPRIYISFVFIQVVLVSKILAIKCISVLYAAIQGPTFCFHMVWQPFLLHVYKAHL